MPSPMFLSSPGVRQPGMLLTTPLNTVILGGSLHFSEPLFNNRPWKKKKQQQALSGLTLFILFIYYWLVGDLKWWWWLHWGKYNNKKRCKVNDFCPYKFLELSLHPIWHQAMTIILLSLSLAPPISRPHPTPPLLGSLKNSRLSYFEEQFHFLNTFHKFSFEFTFAKQNPLRYLTHTKKFKYKIKYS